MKASFKMMQVPKRLQHKVALLSRWSPTGFQLRVHRKLMQMDMNKLLKSFFSPLNFQSYYPLCLPKCKQYQLVCFTDVLNL